MPSVILRPEQPWGNVVQLGNKTYPGLLNRRRVDPIDPLWALAGSTPAVDFNFSSDSMLDQVSGQDLITYTRTSTAWGWDGSQFVEFANDVPRIVVDPATGLRGLLVEAARTNLLLNSDTLSTQTVTVTGAARTLSFYGTGTVTLSGASTAGPLVGTGDAPSRVSLTFTPTAGSLTLTVSGSVRFAMLEIGAFPTSPIITTDSALTRSVDLAVVTGANFPAAIVPLQFTLYSDAYREFAVPSAQFARTVALTTTGATNTDGAGLGYLTESQAAYIVRSGSATAREVYPEDYTGVRRRRVAGAGDASGHAVSTNGAAVVTGAASAMPVSVAEIKIGLNGANGAPLNGIVSRATIWPTRLPDATLQALTA